MQAGVLHGAKSRSDFSAAVTFLRATRLLSATGMDTHGNGNGSYGRHPEFLLDGLTRPATLRIDLVALAALRFSQKKKKKPAATRRQYRPTFFLRKCASRSLQRASKRAHTSCSNVPYPSHFRVPVSFTARRPHAEKPASKPLLPDFQYLV